ncbi:OsmC family protein [Sneathiella chinensis]|uniref:Peroxiredoxin n=1 Tax=Sneathiella chinensis TaxID=349750 RepID=A0ABQ5U437_9PROT|nr:OsmC family protein [Sneathiella chinensis]GLQ06932.1 peroxiredoxin [Sneathiella chinensis]
MKVQAKWVEGYRFIGNNDKGHGIIMDGAGGEERLGVSPMEMILLAVGGCSGIDVVHILKKSRENVEDCIVEVEGTRATEDPKVFTDLHMIYRVKGQGLNRAKVERAVDLSAEKYCSASVMIGQAANITRDIIIEETGA